MKKIEETPELQLQFEKRGGVLPVVVQESSTGEILMIASVNEDALKKSIEEKLAAFWSTSRKELWIKGLTSGNKLHLDEILVDCDQDALIYKVTLDGTGACHTKAKNGKHRKSCFYRKLDMETQQLTFSEE
ncbi:MAG: phosphoribosyl-AMP cyclohydrolase [Balneolaceae bacterium]|nr:phosphoribosyl-AMP cyclohydrolase [Balneolaceae bacterium]